MFLLTLTVIGCYNYYRITRSTEAIFCFKTTKEVLMRRIFLSMMAVVFLFFVSVFAFEVITFNDVKETWRRIMESCESPFTIDDVITAKEAKKDWIRIMENCESPLTIDDVIAVGQKMREQRLEKDTQSLEK